MTASFLAIKFFEILSGKLLEERSQWVLWAPVGIGMGILLYFGMQTEPSWEVGLVGTVFSCTALLFLRILKVAHLGARLLIWLGLMFFLGFKSAQFRTHSIGN